MVSNKIANIYLLVKHGNVEIGKNVMNITQSSINILTPKFINITDNAFKECITHRKFNFDESYIQIEKNIDLSLQNYINLNLDANQKTFIRNNIYKCNFCTVE